MLSRWHSDSTSKLLNKLIVIIVKFQSLDVLWNPPYKSEQNGVIINYLIRYFKTGKSAVRTVNVPGNDRVVTINELSKGTTYAVQVAAQTNGGTGPYSQTKSGTVLVTPNEGKKMLIKNIFPSSYKCKTFPSRSMYNVSSSNLLSKNMLVNCYSQITNCSCSTNISYHKPSTSLSSIS